MATPFGSYDLIEELRAGAAGSVHAARDNKLGRRVALLLPKGEGAERALREARALGQAKDPRLPAVHEVGEHEGQPFAAFELIEGEPLDAALASGNAQRRRALLAELGRALQALHALGLAHGALDAAQVRVASGHARLIDPGWLAAPASRGDAEADRRAFLAIAAKAGALSDASLALEAAIAALSKRPIVTPMRVAFALGLAAAAGALALVARSQSCSNAGREWGDAWDASLATRVDAAFAKTGEKFAAEASRALAAALGEYGARWSAARTAACEAARAPKADAALAGLRIDCLRQRRREAAALGQTFLQVDAAAVGRAVRATADLSPLGDCDNPAALRRTAKAPEGEAAKKVDQLQARSAEAKALTDAGRFAEALQIVSDALPAARALGYAPLTGELLYRKGRLEQRDGRNDEARKTLEEAGELALAAGDDPLLADTWTHLSMVVGARLKQVEAGERYSGYAKAAIDRLGGDPMREAVRIGRLLEIFYSDPARRTETRALLAQQRALLQKAGANDLLVAEADMLHARFLAVMGAHAEALPFLTSAVATYERVLSPKHPLTWSAYVNAMMSLSFAGKRAEAKVYLDKAVANADDRCTSERANVDMALAYAHRARKDFAAALASDERAIKCYRPTEPQRMRVMNNKGNDLIGLGRFAEAVAPLEQVYAFRAQPGRDSEELAESQIPLAAALWEAGGDKARAIALATAARDTLAAGNRTAPSWHRKLKLDEVDKWLLDHPLPASARAQNASARAARP